MRRAVFLDRDGVINENRSDYVKSWKEFKFLPGALASLRRLADTPYAVVIVSNQSAINRGLVSASEVDQINRRMVREIEREGGRVDAVYICPHRPDEGCECRKPKPGLLHRAARELDLDLSASYCVGDALSDVQAALAVGGMPFLVLSGRGREELARARGAGVANFMYASDLAAALDWIIWLSEADRTS